MGNYKNRDVVEYTLPGWGIDDIFEVKLKRINLFEAASKGKIPNPLLPVVTQIFKGDGLNPDDENFLKDSNEVVELFAELSMVEPTFKELKEDIELTDTQKTLIYHFAIGGPTALKTFLKK